MCDQFRSDASLHRILARKERIIVCVYGVLHFADFDVDDAVRPMLLACERKYAPPKDPLMQLNLKPVHGPKPFFATASFGANELLHYASRLPGMSRFISAHGEHTLNVLRSSISRAWGKKPSRKIKVRTKILVLEGAIT